MKTMNPSILILTLILVSISSSHAQLTCTTYDTCTAQLSPFAQCITGRCQCKPGYVQYDRQTQSPSPNGDICVGQLGSSCSQASHCAGPGATCGGRGTCMCKLGYIASKQQSPEKCDRVPCSKASDCSVYFGNYTECSLSECRCKSFDYTYNEQTQRCESLFTEIGHECASSKYNCGIGATCVGGRCRCRAGKVVKPNLQSCEDLICGTNHTLCQQLDPASECNMGVCKCKPDYWIDYDTERCVLKDFPSERWLYAGYVFAGIGALALLVAIPIWAWKVRHLIRERAGGK